MNKFQYLLLAGALAAIPCGMHAQDDLGEPAVTIHTNLYNETGAQNVFTLFISSTTPEYFDVDFGFGTQELEVTTATVTDGAWTGTSTSGPVSKDGVIKIYGDASKIDVLRLEGQSITSIDVSKCVNLDVIDLSHNELTGLDLTPNTNLSAIYLSDNPGSADTPIIVGPAKQNLAILEVDIIDYLDPNFDLKQYPELRSFDAYHTLSLTRADLSNSSKLMSLVLEMTSVAELDLTPAPNITHLNIADSRISHIDLSPVTKLQHLLCGHHSGTINTDVEIAELDVTMLPQLTYLAAEGNNLTSIDVTHNPEIANLYLQYNSLTQLDLSKCTKLASVNINYNNFTWSTMPEEVITWTEYFYDQKPYQVAKSVLQGSEMDFGCMIRPGTTTTAKVYRVPLAGDVTAVDDADFSFSAEGKLVLNKAYADSVYVEFANSAFVAGTVSTGYKLRTSNFMVKDEASFGQPSRIARIFLSDTAPFTFRAGMDGASAESPRKLIVECGSNRQEFDVTSDRPLTDISITPTATMVSLYIPENEVLTGLAISDRKLSLLDIKAATELRYLSVTGCRLATVDLQNNRCLQTLDLSDNALTSLDLKGARGDYEKWVLTSVKAANNKISEFNIVNTTGTVTLDLSHNLLTELALKDYDNLANLDLSFNKLQTANMAYMGNIVNLDLSNNEITELEGMVDMPLCQNFNVANNRFTLETLPYLGESSNAAYTYAPQAMLQIQSKAPGINLSAQYREINGTGTTYTWKTTAGATLTAGTDYRISDDGVTRFITLDKGPVYCVMTNPAFPALAGENEFRTTEVTPMGAPTTVVASFTTPEAVADGQIVFTTKDVDALYIDWRGDEADFVPYTTRGDTYTRYTDIATYAGANVKVYTYNDPSDVTVFSFTGIPMSEFDGSPMTSLINFTLENSGLEPEKLTWPSKEPIRELNLAGNNFNSLDFIEFPSLETVDMSRNQFTSLDLTKAPKLYLAAFASNQISETTFNNPGIWHLDLTDNKIETIDLSGLTGLQQTSLSHNLLSHIDLTPVKDVLRVLLITNNRFTFSTLPVPADYPLLDDGLYNYGNQAPLDCAINDMKVDLSSEAVAGGKETVYRWFLDGFSFNANTGEIEGEELIADDEYTLSNGVTTFNTSYEKPVQAVLTNEAFENLYLYTPLLYFSTAIEAVEADGGDVNVPVTVYNLQGVAVRTNVLPAEATEGLSPGIYIVAGKKVLVR